MDDLKLIKKYYGEKMMHLCRELFPTLLEEEGKLFTLLSEHFAYSRFLYEDIIAEHKEEEFKDFIYSFLDVEKEKKKKSTKTPKELLDEAGYILYECKTESDIQRFKKFYAKNEALCTFRGGRLNRCYVFFAVKKNVDEIKREDFIGKEDRQDEYGTSVISIQFMKDDYNSLSIKNRYNHTVNNPDATFSNNLDNIIPGLTQAFQEEYGFKINSTESSFELDNYVKANDGKFYKYNCEIDNVYFCPDNIVIDNFQAKRLDKSRYLLIDYFILDMESKRIYEHKGIRYVDSFVDSIGKIESIRIENDKENDNKIIRINDDIIIVLNKKNQIIKYINTHVTEIGNCFLERQEELQTLELPNVKSIGSNFLYNNEFNLISLDIHNVEHIGNLFLARYRPSANNPRRIQTIDLPKCKTIGEGFCYSCYSLDKINLPNVTDIRDFFMYLARTINEMNLPNLQYVGRDFCYSLIDYKEVKLDSAQYIFSGFMANNFKVETVILPKVVSIGPGFLWNSTRIKKIDAPELEKIGKNSLRQATELEEVNLPKLSRDELEKIPEEVRKIIEELMGKEGGMSR